MSRVILFTLLSVVAGGCAAKSADALLSQDDMLAEIAYLSDDRFQGRGCRSPEARQVAAHIAARFKAAGLEAMPGGDGYYHDVEDEAMSPNVIGVRRGSGADFVLISAHYDHLPPRTEGDDQTHDRIYNGADDNASGTAALMAIADAMQRARTRSDASIVFIAFSGEEAGLRGSRCLAGKPPFPLRRVRGVLNMDMISRGAPDVIFVDGGKEAGRIRQLLREENERLAIGLRIRMDEHPDWLQRSDQGPFIRRKVPAVLFSVEDHEDYHQVTDEVDRVLPQLVHRVARLVTAVSLRLADTPG